MIGARPQLVADIGGTNARFGWIDGASPEIRDVRTLACDDHAGVAEAIEAYLAQVGLPRPSAVAMGVATPVDGDLVRLTNRPSWTFSQQQLQRELELERLVVLNDFTALALALPTLAPSELRPIGGGRALAGHPIALIGPGTGLGASGLIPHGNHWLPLSGEGGHVSLAATDDREAAVVQLLRRRFGHASGERALSGNGLVWLYEAVCALDGRRVDALTPADLCARVDDPVCREVVSLFCAMLGTLAGNLALTLGARGGVYIGGGIVPRLVDAFERSPFRERFEDKGRCRGYLAAVPTFVICASVSPALAGAARALGL